MEVIVKSSPKIEIEFATKVVKVGEGSRVDIDSALSTTSENPVMNKVITKELASVVNDIETLKDEKVFLTEAEYDSLEEKDESKLYFVFEK